VVPDFSKYGRGYRHGNCRQKRHRLAIEESRNDIREKKIPILFNSDSISFLLLVLYFPAYSLF
jgi:hypothetical protein